MLTQTFISETNLKNSKCLNNLAPFGCGNPETPLLTQSGWRLEAGSCEQRAVAVDVAVAVAVAGERVKDAVEKADEKPEGEDVQGEDTIPEGPN